MADFKGIIKSLSYQSTIQTIAGAFSVLPKGALNVTTERELHEALGYLMGLHRLATNEPDLIIIHDPPIADGSMSRATTLYIDSGNVKIGPPPKFILDGHHIFTDGWPKQGARVYWGLPKLDKNSHVFVPRKDNSGRIDLSLCRGRAGWDTITAIVSKACCDICWANLSARPDLILRPFKERGQLI